MKVAGIKMTDPWASRVLRGKGVESERVAGVPVETKVMMEQVAFEHHGSEKNYRPLLHLTGELQSIRPEGPLPYGIHEVTFRAGLGPTVDAFYEFDDVQLAELVSKGYFTEGFEPPADMTGIPWDLPTTIDALVLAPDHEEDTPVVFVTIHGQTELALNADNSGYELAGYFENKLTSEAVREQTLPSVSEGVPTRSGQINDLFADVDFTAPEAGQWDEAVRSGRENPGNYPVVRASIFEDLMAEFQEKHPVAEVDPESEPEELLSDPIESIYNQRIAPGVEKALSLPSGDQVVDSASDQSEPAEDPETRVQESVLPDLYEKEEELGVVPVAIEPAAEAVWGPDQDALTGSGDMSESGAEADQRKSDPAQRRVQRALAHERAALEMERVAAEDEPQLG